MTWGGGGEGWWGGGGGGGGVVGGGGGGVGSCSGPSDKVVINQRDKLSLADGDSGSNTRYI